MSARPIVRAGDILLVRGSATISRLILWGERSKADGEDAPLPSHAALIVDDHGGIVEANADGVDYTADLFAKYDDIAHKIAIYRPIGLTSVQRSMVVLNGRRLQGRPYGYLELFVHMADQKLFGGRVVARKLLSVVGDRFEICSKVVAQAYAGVRSFGVPAYAAEPDDILRWVKAHPEQWAPVFTFGAMEPGWRTPDPPKEAA